MLRIKLKAQNSKLKANRTLGAGFTLIEMIIAISILGIVALIASGFLLTTLSGSGKAEINKEVRQNGNYALSTMEGLIISAKSVSCPTTKEIDVVDLNGFLAKFICDDATTYKISSSSPAFATPVDLTATNVAVSGCDFACTAVSGEPTKVSIEFKVSQRGTSLRPNEKSSIRFQTEVMLRNF